MARPKRPPAPSLPPFDPSSLNQEALTLLRSECAANIRADVLTLRAIIRDARKASDAPRRPDAGVAIKAIQLKWAYAFGTPTQTVDVTERFGLTPDQLAAMPALRMFAALAPAVLQEYAETGRLPSSAWRGAKVIDIGSRRDPPNSEEGNGNGNGPPAA